MEQNAQPIVVAVPNDDDLEAALSYAAAEARVHHTGLRLVHAHPDGDEGHAELVLARAAAMARLLAGPAVRVTTRRVTGSPVETVLTANPDASLVVLRRRDSLHLLHFLARGCSRSVTSPPIACVPREWSPRVRDPRPVLLAVADPNDSATLLRHGLEIASAHHTRLRVLHAWHLPGHADELIDRQVGPELAASFRAALQAGLDSCHYRDDFGEVQVDLEVRHGIGAEVVMEAARDAQLLLLGRNAPASDGSIHLGRTSRAALNQSPCPTVLLSPPATTGAFGSDHAPVRTAAFT